MTTNNSKRPLRAFFAETADLSSAKAEALDCTIQALKEMIAKEEFTQAVGSMSMSCMVPMV